MPNLNFEDLADIKADRKWGLEDRYLGWYNGEVYVETHTYQRWFRQKAINDNVPYYFVKLPIETDRPLSCFKVRDILKFTDERSKRGWEALITEIEKKVREADGNVN